jgi:hypothetical protein
MPSVPPTGRAAVPEIREAIQTAAKRTGVSFDFLVKQAEAESGFDPNAKAGTSSATGLYQFIDSTWLSMVRQFGAKYGIPEAAEAVTQSASGAPRIGDPALRARVLDLRKDPRLAAAMAAEFAKGNQEHLRGALGREPSATDLYMAHFLGPQGATRFLRARGQNGEQSAAETMPEAAAANRAVFYAADGRPRSLDEVHARFARRFEATPLGPASPDIVEAVARTERGRMRSQALFAAMNTRVQALQGLSTQGVQPLTVAALAALDDRQGRTVAGRAAKRGLI